MPEWVAILLLGLIEGVTEFLPVSSTGHLLLAEHWLGQRSDLFNTIIQSGAVLAVLAVFWKRALSLVTHWNEPESRDFLLKLLAAFVLTAIGGLLLKKMGWRLPHDPAPVAWATLIGGVLFLAVEYGLKGKKGDSSVTWSIAMAIGAAHLVAAALPGSSRSGTTILIGLVLGLTRPAATEFSFLLGIPTLLAAGAKETLDALKDHTPHEPVEMLLLGMLVAAVTAFLVVRWLLGYVRQNSFVPFAWYRIALGVVLLVSLRR